MIDYKKVYIFHITHYGNLKSIFSNGFLCSDSFISKNNIQHTNISHLHIKHIRKNKPTPLGCTLSECVPFYFGILTPMLFAISRNNVDGYADGQKSVVYLVSNIQNVVNSNLEFCFSDGHAIEALTNFYTSLDDLQKLDFNAIRSKQWASCYQGIEEDFKRRKQSEFLVKGNFASDLFIGIAVFDENIKKILEVSLNGLHHPPIEVLRDWYF